MMTGICIDQTHQRVHMWKGSPQAFSNVSEPACNQLEICVGSSWPAVASSLALLLEQKSASWNPWCCWGPCERHVAGAESHWGGFSCQVEVSIQLCGGRSLGRQGITWGLPGVSCSICLILICYRFSHVWLAGGRYWRNIRQLSASCGSEG